MDRLYEYYDVTGGSDFITSGFVDVFHYDPSTFYNYSQDNLSVTSLESRLDNLAQAVGFPGSTSYSGVTLVVSSTGSESDISGVYTTAQAAVDSLPRVLNYPVTIQLADYGNQGALSLVGIKCEGAGAVQIEALNYGSDAQAEVIGTVVRGDLSSVSSISSTIVDTAILNAADSRYSDNTFNAASWKANGRAFGQRSPDTLKETQVLSFAAPGVGADWTFSSAAATFIVEQYQQYSGTYDQSISADIVPVNNLGGSLLTYRDDPDSGDTATMVAYGSYFSSISIRDCNRVKLKGILVDGVTDDSSDFQYSSTIGLSAVNSNVLLEDFAVTRCSSRGIFANNSKLSVAKSLIVHRIYNKQNGVGAPTQRGVGIELYNSNLVFDTIAAAYSGRHMRIVTEGCSVGVSCNNSLICGGTRDQRNTNGYIKNAGGSDTTTSHLQASRNGLGYYLKNSVLDFDGRLDCFLNLSGIDAVQSDITTPQFSIDDNQEHGIRLNSSNLFYGKHNDFLNDFGGVSSSGIQLFHCDYNGINLIALNNSHVSVDRNVSEYPSVGSWGGNTPLFVGETNIALYGLMRNFGVKESTMLPAIVVDGNSTAHIIGLGYTGDVGYSRKGAAAVATRNSSILFQGVSGRWTTITSNGEIESADDLKKLWTSAAVVAKKNSKVSFVGPSKISRYGVGVLSEDHSTSYFGPPEELEAGLDASKHGLSSKDNQTKIEVHSNRACVVANNDSRVRMYGLGVSADASSTYGSVETSDIFKESTKNSYVALLPNGFTELLLSDSTLSAVALGGNLQRYSRDAGLVSDYETGHDTGSTGGVCVRVVDNSDIDVDLVNFKFGMSASSVSGVMYNWHGSGLEFIDNMDNHVQLSQTTDACWIADLCCECPTTTTAPSTIPADATTVTTVPYTTTSTTPYTTTSTETYTTTSTSTFTTTVYTTTSTSTFTTTSTLTDQTTTIYSTTATTPYTTTVSTLFTTTSTLTDQTTTIYSTTATTAFTTTATTEITTTATTAFTTTATTEYTTPSTPTTTDYTTTETTTFTTEGTPTTTFYTTTVTTPYTTRPTETTTLFTTTATTSFTTTATTEYTTTATTEFTTTATLTDQTTTIYSTTSTEPYTTTATTSFTTTATTAYTTTSTEAFTTTATTSFTTTATTPFTTTATTPYTTTATGETTESTLRTMTIKTAERVEVEQEADFTNPTYGGDGEFLVVDGIEFSGFGTKIHIWNVCDFSRIRVARVLLNGNDPHTECVNNDWHGPTGRWWNGTACDYYGKYGYAAVKRWQEHAFRNQGVFRLQVGGDGDLKMLEETEAIPFEYYGSSIRDISSLEDGSPYDQVNAQGYLMTADHAYTLSDITYASAVNEYKYVTNNTSVLSAVLAFGDGLPGYFQSPGQLNGMITHARMNEGADMYWNEGQLHPALAVPPLRMKWSGYLDNRVDESAASLFANARHAANKKVNLVSIDKSTVLTGGSGRDSNQTASTFGLGVRSLDTFELTQLV